MASSAAAAAGDAGADAPWSEADEAVTAATFASLLHQLPDDLKASLLREALRLAGPACLVGLER